MLAIGHTSWATFCCQLAWVLALHCWARPERVTLGGAIFEGLDPLPHFFIVLASFAFKKTFYPSPHYIKTLGQV